MTERLREPLPPRVVVEPPSPERELARKNTLLGLALFGLCVVIFAGTIGVALVYLALD